MLREITWPQFLEWLAYDAVDPFGEERMDARTAQISQTLINLNRRKHQEPYKLSEIMLPFGDYEPPPPPKQSWQQMKFMMMQMSAALGTPAPPEVTVSAADLVSGTNG